MFLSGNHYRICCLVTNDASSEITGFVLRESNSHIEAADLLKKKWQFCSQAGLQNIAPGVLLYNLRFDSSTDSLNSYERSELRAVAKEMRIPPEILAQHYVGLLPQIRQSAYNAVVNNKHIACAPGLVIKDNNTYCIRMLFFYHDTQSFMTFYNKVKSVGPDIIRPMPKHRVPQFTSKTLGYTELLVPLVSLDTFMGACMALGNIAFNWNTAMTYYMLAAQANFQTECHHSDVLPYIQVYAH